MGTTTPHGTGLAVREGDLLWTPSPDQAEHTRLTEFTRFAAARTGREFPDYAALWRWSTTELEEFWSAIWDFFDVRASEPPTAVLAERTMPGARWFPGARLNFAEHVLRNERPGAPALLAVSETSPVREVPWAEFARQVRRLAGHLRERGVRPGDRVVAYLPNVPEAIVAMLACAAVGAVWATCSPDFGARGALDRLGQLAPTVLVATDGYRYGGRDFDRRAEVDEIVAGLPTLREVITVPVLGLEPSGTPWADILAGPDPDDFACEQVPFDHPLWVLFSSGTTGLPKAIVHGHGGILLEHLKLTSFHMDLRPGDRTFFFTTTGWMMWNSLIGMMLVGAVPVLYDGNPAHPDVDASGGPPRTAGPASSAPAPASSSSCRRPASSRRSASTSPRWRWSCRPARRCRRRSRRGSTTTSRRTSGSPPAAAAPTAAAGSSAGCPPSRCARGRS